MKVFQHVTLALGAVLLSAGVAEAQSTAPIAGAQGYSLEPGTEQPPEFSTIMSRARPDYDRLGMRVGAFIFYPSMALSETYDSNIFAIRTGTSDDFYTTLQPSLSVISDWSRHALAFNASGQFKWYAKHDSENVNNGAVNAQGRIDIENGSWIALSGAYALQHEDRSSPDSLTDIREPTQYTTSTGSIGSVREKGRIGLRADASVTSYSFNNNETFGGVLVPEKGRDRIEYVGSLRASYEILPQQPYQAFVRLVGNSRQYNSVDTISAVPARRNSNGYEIDAGTAVEITRLLTGEVYAGYLAQEYQSPLFSSPHGVGFGGNLLWSATELTSVKGAFSRSVVETVVTGASSSVETSLSLSVEHELRRNIVLVGGLGYINDEYSGVNRSDDTYAGNVGVRYFMNRIWRLSGDVTYAQRNSSVGADFNRVIATVGVEAGF